MDSSGRKGIGLARDGHVAIVRFSRPPSNYFDLELLTDLADTFAEIDSDPELRAIALLSEGTVFCAGAALTRIDPGSDGPEELYGQAVRLFRTAKPIVVGVQGPAIGGGLGLAMIGDFRVAAPEARFSANFVKIGINPGFGLTHTLPRLIGEQAAMQLFLTGRRIDGEHAVRIGLADALAPRDELAAETVRLAAEIGENAPLAVQATRSLVRGQLAEAVAASAAAEARVQRRLIQTNDFREGVRAVAEKRSGQWSGT